MARKKLHGKFQGTDVERRPLIFKIVVNPVVKKFFQYLKKKVFESLDSFDERGRSIFHRIMAWRL